MRCPNCKNRVLQKSGSQTRVRTQGPITFLPDGRCIAQCFWCKALVEIPLEIKKGTPIVAEQFILPRKA